MHDTYWTTTIKKELKHYNHYVMEQKTATMKTPVIVSL